MNHSHKKTNQLNQDPVDFSTLPLKGNDIVSEVVYLYKIKDFQIGSVLAFIGNFWKKQKCVCVTFSLSSEIYI